MTEHNVTYEHYTSRTATPPLYVYAPETTQIRSSLELSWVNYVLLCI